MYGPQYREQLSDIIRRAAEFCDCLQCFFLIHSMGGGTLGCVCAITSFVCGNRVRGGGGLCACLCEFFIKMFPIWHLVFRN